MGIDCLASQLQMLTSSKCMSLVWCESIVVYNIYTRDGCSCSSKCVFYQSTGFTPAVQSVYLYSSLCDFNQSAGFSYSSKCASSTI